MPDPSLCVLFALAFPLFAAIFIACRASSLRHTAHVPAIAAFAGSAVSAFAALAQLSGSESFLHLPATPCVWFSAGSLTAEFSLQIDPLALVMLATVSFVSIWIALFSAGYMHDDPGYARYFAVMAFFVFSMLLLVTADNLLLLLAGWEGVGLCSYLLVGFYYVKPSAAAAARKAFLVTRLGDIGLIAGILLLWRTCGGSTNLSELAAYAAAHPELNGQLTTACLLLFCGAIGKSAQLPLHVWLPDAMEGPTPVSALIHAATMVTAGVYLLARCAPFFVLAPDAQAFVTFIGGMTAMMAAFLAVGQNDLKRVLAYSTVSQLGFMFMALGCGGPITPSLAAGAAIFHLFTHAFFKALLFLGAGSVMHAMGTIDLRRFGGLRQLMPTTYWTFLIGTAALAGLPLLSGFWSKDAILDALAEASHAPHENASLYRFFLYAGVGTAALTAFYSFRVFFLTFHGPERIPESAGHHAHESPGIMTTPLLVLALFAAGAGLMEPLGHRLGTFLARTPSLVAADKLSASESHAHFNWKVAFAGTVAALAGLGLAYRRYGQGGPEQIPDSLRGAVRLSQNRLYIDDIYESFVVEPAEVAASAARQLDGAVAPTGSAIATLPQIIGAALKPLQNGLIQFYALGSALGLVVLLAVVVLRSTR